VICYRKTCRHEQAEHYAGETQRFKDRGVCDRCLRSGNVCAKFLKPPAHRPLSKKDGRALLAQHRGSQEKLEADLAELRKQAQ
jgi:hypothetical protein